MDFFCYVHALVNLAEWGVVAVEEACAVLVGDDEKLAADGDRGAAFGHGDCAVKMAVGRVDFVGKHGARAVKTVAAGAVFLGEVAALDHEIFDDAVERRVGVFSGFS